MKQFPFFKVAIIAGSFFSGIHANAQMVGTDVFLKGRYVEVGIGKLGYYGSNGAAPTGYHPHEGGVSSTKIGFVADVGMDGWTVGSPAYMGDYFLPGSPFEGWMLQVDGKRCQAYGNVGSFAYSGGMGTCVGSNVSHTATGTKVIGRWRGMIDSIDVEQITMLDTNDLFFLVKIILTNTAVAPKNNIYYFRSLEPDNDQTWPGGGFSTDNMITHQMPGDPANSSVITATGHSSPAAFMAIGTADTNSRAMIYGSWGLTVSQDLNAVYAGTYGGGGAFYNVGANHPGDIGLGITMYIPHIATVDSAGDSVLRTTAGSTLHPANTAAFNYFVAFSQAALDSAIAQGSNFEIPTLSIKNVSNPADIKVYPNPSKETINITNLNPTDVILLYDMMGRDMRQGWQVMSEGTNTYRYDNIPAGAYVVVVADKTGNIKARVPVRKQ